MIENKNYEIGRTYIHNRQKTLIVLFYYRDRYICIQYIPALGSMKILKATSPWRINPERTLL